MDEDWSNKAFKLLKGWKTVHIKRNTSFFNFDVEFEYDPKEDTATIAFRLQKLIQSRLHNKVDEVEVSCDYDFEEIILLIKAKRFSTHDVYGEKLHIYV
jgi:hypothetical protein